MHYRSAEEYGNRGISDLQPICKNQGVLQDSLATVLFSFPALRYDPFIAPFFTQPAADTW